MSEQFGIVFPIILSVLTYFLGMYIAYQKASLSLVSKDIELGELKRKLAQETKEKIEIAAELDLQDQALQTWRDVLAEVLRGASHVNSTLEAIASEMTQMPGIGGEE